MQPSPPAIKGYRQLTHQEIDAVSVIKDLGLEIQAVIDSISDPDPRWKAIATTDFQTALMALTRAITKPEWF